MPLPSQLSKLVVLRRRPHSPWHFDRQMHVSDSNGCGCGRFYCMDKVVNIEFPNGRIGFAFNLKRRGQSQIVTISFFGDGEKQLHLNADTAMQPIDKVHFTFKGSTDDLVAAGSCRFSNPYKGVPAEISCIADTNQGKFIGEFISNGRSPNMSQSR